MAELVHITPDMFPALARLTNRHGKAQEFIIDYPVTWVIFKGRAFHKVYDQHPDRHLVWHYHEHWLPLNRIMQTVTDADLAPPESDAEAAPDTQTAISEEENHGQALD